MSYPQDEPDILVHTYEPNLGLATTGELLDELKARNEVGQRPTHHNTMTQVEHLLVKLHRAFALRPGGLDYRTVDE